MHVLRLGGGGRPGGAAGGGYGKAMTLAAPAPDAPGPAPLVDWAVAAQMAGRLARPGPVATRGELADLVDGLRSAASAAMPHVLDVTQMAPPTPQTGAVYVVDRARWAQANTEVMAALTEGAAEAIAAVAADASARPGAPATPGPTTPGAAADAAPRPGAPAPLPGTSAATALVGAAQVGAVLAALSSRVLGQFDPYTRVPGDAGPGRLLLVAPNVLQLERSLDLAPRDFRLWVCLHEQTHAVQFAVAPWLAGHLRDRARSLVVDLSDSSRRLADARLREKLAVTGRAVLQAVRGEGGMLLDGILTVDQKRALEEVSAVMALLEGHADVAMDAVGPRTVRTVHSIRSKFEARRDGAGRGRADAVLRRLLGMDAKIAQYRDGAAFVRAVEREVGRDGFNAVWAAPENLPSPLEIADARAWVRRVHG